MSNATALVPKVYKSPSVEDMEILLPAPLPSDKELELGMTEATGGYFTTDYYRQWQKSASKEIENEIVHELQQDKGETFVSPFIDSLQLVNHGVDSIAHDDFTECFRPKTGKAWNFTPILFVTWCIGIVLRYFILFPIRLLILLGGTLLFAMFFPLAFLIWNPKWRSAYQMHAISWYIYVWLLSLSAVIRFHNIPPVRRKKQIYVANHTTVLDFLVISQHANFATVGQKHGGVMGLIQDKVITPLGNIWFERFESRDRKLVAKRILSHIDDLSKPPLMIFPEGVCVNNEYIVMFKKGVFEIEDVEICPIALKYNKLFADPYWNSKEESFLRHIFRIMKSWCFVCDIYFLEPQTKRSHETSTQFAERVKKIISHKAHLKEIPWDGYYKYYSPSASMLTERQKVHAKRLLNGCKFLTAGDSATSGEQAAKAGKQGGDVEPDDLTSMSKRRQHQTADDKQ